jgi:hypothetical protein
MTMEQERITIEKFLSDYAPMLSISSTRAESRPDRTGSDHRQDHWSVTLKSDAGALHVYYSKGLWLRSKADYPVAPSLPEVLSCLGSYAATFENARDVDDFAAEMSGDMGIAEVVRLYEEYGRIAHELRSMLGAEEYDVLLWHTEPL